MNDLRITHWSRCYVSALTRTGAQPKDAKQFADMALVHFDEFVSPKPRKREAKPLCIDDTQHEWSDRRAPSAGKACRICGEPKPDVDAVAPVQRDHDWWLERILHKLERECGGCCVNDDTDRTVIALAVAKMIMDEQT